MKTLAVILATFTLANLITYLPPALINTLGLIVAGALFATFGRIIHRIMKGAN